MTSTRRLLQPAALVLGAAVILSAWLTPGCASTHSDVVNDNGWSTLTTKGDWNDLDAAIEVASISGELALLESRPISSSERQFQFIAITDQRAVLRAQAYENEPGQITLRFKVGLEGDPERESRFLRALADRLGRLAGVEWAPLP